MKFPSLKRINKLDFDPQYSSLIDKLGNILNYTLELFYTAMTNNLSLGDNLLCSLNTITVTVDSTGVPTATSTYQLSNTNILSPIQGVTVLNVINNTNNNALLTGAPFVDYTLSQNQQVNSNGAQTNAQTQSSPYIVTINQITGLIA